MEEIVKEKDEYKFSRFMYILEAAFEYLIALLVSGKFLAKLTNNIGLSDGVTGVLSAFASLGCGFQIFSIFLSGKKRVKRWVSVLHSINQLFFALLYVVPVVPVSKTVKTVAFVAFLLIAHVINNIVNSPKINWFMSLVEDKKRGAFTANKEIVSLIGGATFSFLMGSVIDYFESINNINGAFVFSAITVFVLAILHTATLLFSKEKETEGKEKTPLKPLLKELVRDKNLFKIILVSVFWNVAHYVATPFFGSYQEKELAFSDSFYALIIAIGSFARAVFSRPLGKYADKYSFRKMLNVCFWVEVVAFFVGAFITPSNGKVMYTLYYVLYLIGMAGINSGAINLIYDYVETDKRMAAFALKNAFAGFAGFFTTLAVSPLIGYIQGKGNRFLGLNVYAQQITSSFACVLVILLIVYLNTVVKKIRRPQEINSVDFESDTVSESSESGS